ADQIQHDDSDYWIGLNDLSEAGNFRWLESTENAVYMNLVQDPDNAEDDVNAHCVYVQRTSHDAWRLDDCMKLKRSICEFTPELFCVNVTRYDQDCSSNCSTHCAGSLGACFRNSGWCAEGCTSGATGPMCQGRIAGDLNESPNDEPASIIPAIVTVFMCGLVLASLFGVAVFSYRRRRQESKLASRRPAEVSDVPNPQVEHRQNSDLLASAGSARSNETPQSLTTFPLPFNLGAWSQPAEPRAHPSEGHSYSQTNAPGHNPDIHSRNAPPALVLNSKTSLSADHEN
ncbi:hypothetical protein EGW08_008716, partial [Elysia chlorotica]